LEETHVSHIGSTGEHMHILKCAGNFMLARVDNNPYLCVNDTCNSSPNRKKAKLALGLGLGLGLGVPVVTLVAAVAVWFLIKRIYSKGNEICWLKFLSICFIKSNNSLTVRLQRGR